MNIDDKTQRALGITAHAFMFGAIIIAAAAILYKNLGWLGIGFGVAFFAFFGLVVVVIRDRV